MKTKAWWIAPFLAVSCVMACAQDITGDWQGTLAAGPQQLRLIVRVEKGDHGTWKASMASIDHRPRH